MRTPLRFRPALAAASALALAGCNTSQSALHPQGPHAEAVARLTWAMTIGGAAIFVLVMALIAVAVLAPPERRSWLTRRGLVVALGFVFPSVTVGGLLAYGFILLRAVRDPGPAALRIEVVGEMWWWRVNYLDDRGEVRFASANEIRIPTGAQVEFVLKSADVIHSFWVPSLGGKLDMIPGRTNAYRLAATRPGIYRGQCAEYCGAQHATMAFYTIAMEQADFDAWLARQMEPAPAPSTDETARGAKLFFENGCQVCHAVRGTGADGLFGPDLTHVGSRTHIGAGLLPNNVGTLAAWIASAQHLKPESKMASFLNLSGEDLRALAAYLEGLK